MVTAPVDSLLDIVRQSFGMLIAGDQQVWAALGVSFSVSLQAIALAAPPALCLAFVLAQKRFPGRGLVISLLHTLLALPTMFIGLCLYLLLSRTGPLGDLNLLFSRPAMVLGQALLAAPIIAALGHATLEMADRRAWETARTLGAGSGRAMLTVMYEVRYGLMVAVIMAFGRVISEIGCSLVVGGNIVHLTRNIPTALSTEAARGDIFQALALGTLLLSLALAMNLSIQAVRSRLEP